MRGLDVDQCTDIAPDIMSVNCPNCHSQLRKGYTAAKILFWMDVKSITIIDYSCSCCGFSHVVDGSEFCILRKQPFNSAVLGRFELCFAWEVLYQMSDKVEAGSFYYSVLVELMKNYQRYEGWGEDKLCAMQSFYRPLKEAFMDFIDLMRLPMCSTWCTCESREFIADGVMVATRRNAMHLAGAWLPQPPQEGAPLVPALFGSLYGERFAVKSKSLRRALRLIASAEGCTYGQLQELQGLCTEEAAPALLELFGTLQPDLVVAHDADEAPMAAMRHNQDDSDDANGDFDWHEMVAEDLPKDGCFVEELPTGMMTVPAWSREFIMELSADSPAVAIVPLKDVACLQRWHDCVLQHTDWSKEDSCQARNSMPCLSVCLQTVHGMAQKGVAPAMCDAFASLVYELIEVRVFPQQVLLGLLLVAPCSGVNTLILLACS